MAIDLSRLHSQMDDINILITNYLYPQVALNLKGYKVIVSTMLHCAAYFIAFLLVGYIIRSSLRFVGNNQYAVVERLWSFSTKKRDDLIALHGEPGYQPETLSGGPHFFFPTMYRVHKRDMITVKGIAYIFARDGKPMTEGQTLARWPTYDDGSPVKIEDSRAFLERGGQKGPQRYFLRPGVYSINTALFAIMTEEGMFALDIGENEILKQLDEKIRKNDGYNPVVLSDDVIGVVTVNDGPSLDHGEIIAPSVGTNRDDEDTYHNSFQSIEKFLKAGGRSGRQQQVLVEGTYYINRLFATVEVKPKEMIPIGMVGVVNSFIGKGSKSFAEPLALGVTSVESEVRPEDKSHGRLVKEGEKGIWDMPLPPGKYPVNPLAMSITQIPTTNLILRWEEGVRGDHRYDENLKEIQLITKDGYEPKLGLAVVVHIKPEDAPFVVQKFSSPKLLIEQTMDAVVASWFKDAAQEITIVELIQKRSELQKKAKADFEERFAKFKISLVDIVLGTPNSAPGSQAIEVIYEQLQARQLAIETAETFKSKQSAAVAQREFNEASAIAENQNRLTESKISIEVAQNKGDSDLILAQRKAQAEVANAEANAKRIELEGSAEAQRIKQIGQAEADAYSAQVNASGGQEVALQKALAEILADAVKKSQVPLVPSVYFGGSEAGANTTPMEALLRLAVSKLSTEVLANTAEA